MEFLVRRYGFKESLEDRGGTWFEIVTSEYWKYSESMYMDFFKPVYETDVEEYGLFYALINTVKPYFYKVDNTFPENYYPVLVYAHLHKIDPYKLYTSLEDEITRISEDVDYADSLESLSEKTYAKLEREIATDLKNKGYDSVIFVRNLYDEVLFYNNDKSVLNKDQIFYFGNDIRWLN